MNERQKALYSFYLAEEGKGFIDDEYAVIQLDEFYNRKDELKRNVSKANSYALRTLRDDVIEVTKHCAKTIVADFKGAHKIGTYDEILSMKNRYRKIGLQSLEYAILLMKKLSDNGQLIAIDNSIVQLHTVSENEKI